MPPETPAAAACEPDNEVARQILSQCVVKFPDNSGDCNQFLKAVASEFFDASIFSGLNADAIISLVKQDNSGWAITEQIPDAIAAAKAGKFVAAGMTSTDLQEYHPGTVHGHLAVVIGCDGQVSGTTVVPLGYAGSLENPAARISGTRLSGTFPPLAVRNQEVTYFVRTPIKTPDASGFQTLMAHIAGVPSIAWGKAVSAAFKNRVIVLSTSIGCDPNHLMACMAFESGETFSPSVKNPVSGAIGLIQFMPSTAKSLGTTSEALAQMSAVDQLDYVEDYFDPWKGKLTTLPDLYMAILAPFAIGKPDSTALYKQGTAAYEQNKGLDHDMDGVITKAEAAGHVQAKLAKGLDPTRAG